MTVKEVWTNASVQLMAGNGDPVQRIVELARAKVLEGMDKGWTGPPYDPFALARIMGVRVQGNDAVAEARTVAESSDELRIEVNPNRPRARVRYSIAHELAHTLFPDCAKHVRNRAAYHEMLGDEWQLEALCNVAAAEFLMPAGSFSQLRAEDLNIDRVLDLRQEYEVSTEAVLIRSIRLAPHPMAMFAASRVDVGPSAGKFRLDYTITSSLGGPRLARGSVVPIDSGLAQCKAIGYTAKFQEVWAGVAVRCEAVAVPPYPGSAFPRIVGLIRAGKEHVARPEVGMTELKGNALEPRKEPALIAHIVNDATPNWGGRGFAQAVRERFPQVQGDFQRWAKLHRNAFKLGNDRIYGIHSGLWIDSMVAQEGYGPLASGPRLRYGPLQQCLIQLAEHARERRASIHMPRIGTGQAGGDWGLIQELIRQEVCDKGVEVFVYQLPNRATPSSKTPGAN